MLVKTMYNRLSYLLIQSLKNLNSIFGIELLCAAQGVESRQPLKTSPLLQNAVDELRKDVPRLNEDRFVANDINNVSKLLDKKNILKSSKLDLPISTFFNL